MGVDKRLTAGSIWACRSTIVVKILSNVGKEISRHLEAMAKAYFSGVYTTAEIGQHFKVHYMTDCQSGSKAISCKKYTRMTSLFVRLLRCKNDCIACYAHIFTPCIRTKILRHSGIFILVNGLKKHEDIEMVYSSAST